MTKTKSAILLSLIALTFLSACRDVAGPPLTDLIAARARWTAHRPSSYEYRLTISCFCVVRPVIVTVVGTTATAATHVDDGTPVSAEELSHLPSIDGLFDLVIHARSQNYAQADATFEPILGYPLTISLDHATGMADDEVWYSVSRFAVR
jgi:hypothetical protein